MGAQDSVKLRSVIKLLEKNGYKFMRQNGSHMTFKKPGVADIITLAKHGKEIKTYAAKTVMFALGLSLEDFLKEIKKL